MVAGIFFVALPVSHAQPLLRLLDSISRCRHYSAYKRLVLQLAFKQCMCIF